MKIVSLSIPEDLVHFADAWAAEHGVSRSQAVAEALRVLKRAGRDRLMAEGYRYYADLEVELAEEGMAATNEIWPRE